MKDLIRQGERSAQVADVQTRLRTLGFQISDELGAFGPSTVSAVRAFQQQRQILIDGIVGPNTWEELIEAGYRLGDRILYLRQPPLRGDDVVVLQARLNALGFDAGREDGIFGRDTDEAVRAFQRDYGVPEDGVFGRLTHAALKGLRADRPGTAAGLREELRRIERAGLHEASVVLDPGHGGEDRGAVGLEGTYEADLCWDISTRVADRLAGVGASVRFTRTEIENLDASERARRANDLDADVFMSIHLNSADQQTAHGASTYHFPRSRAGELLADSMQAQLVRLGIEDCRSHPRSYPILRETKMPAVLVEPGFITNADDERLLNDATFRNALSEALVRGFLGYFDAGT